MFRLSYKIIGLSSLNLAGRGIAGRGLARLWPADMDLACRAVHMPNIHARCRALARIGPKF